MWFGGSVAHGRYDVREGVCWGELVPSSPNLVFHLSTFQVASVVLGMLSPETKPGTVLLIRQEGSVQQPFSRGGAGGARAQEQGGPKLGLSLPSAASGSATASPAKPMGGKLQREAMATWATRDRPASYKKASSFRATTRSNIHWCFAPSGCLSLVSALTSSHLIPMPRHTLVLCPRLLVAVLIPCLRNSIDPSAPAQQLFQGGDAHCQCTAASRRRRAAAGDAAAAPRGSWDQRLRHQLHIGQVQGCGGGGSSREGSRPADQQEGGGRGGGGRGGRGKDPSPSQQWHPLWRRRVFFRECS